MFEILIMDGLRRHPFRYDNLSVFYLKDQSLFYEDLVGIKYIDMCIRNCVSQIMNKKLYENYVISRYKLFLKNSCSGLRALIMRFLDRKERLFPLLNFHFNGNSPMSVHTMQKHFPRFYGKITGNLSR